MHISLACVTGCAVSSSSTEIEVDIVVVVILILSHVFITSSFLMLLHPVTVIIVVVVNVSRRLNVWGRGCCSGSRRWLCGIVVIVAVQESVS